MAVASAGIVLYRRSGQRSAAGPAPGRVAGQAAAGLEVLLVHPGGPYWAKRDDGWWSIPKGEIEAGEDPLAAAEREVEEELGRRLPPGRRLPLGAVVQAGGKRVHAWAAEGDLDPAEIDSATFEMEWPPRSGQRQAFPEVDRAAWYGLDHARTKILPGQLPLLDRLWAALSPDGDAPAD